MFLKYTQMYNKLFLAQSKNKNTLLSVLRTQTTFILHSVIHEGGSVGFFSS